MTKKMLIVMFSTNPAKKKIIMNKKINKNILIFFFVFDRVRTCDLRVLIELFTLSLAH